jgi:hypothetical protein
MAKKEGWGNVNSAAEYAEKSPRVIRYWLKNGLRHSRNEYGGVSIKYEWIDEYLESKEVRRTHVDRIVDDVMKDL